MQALGEMGAGKLMVQSMKDTRIQDRGEIVGALWSLSMIPGVANEAIAFGGAEYLVEILISGTYFPPSQCREHDHEPSLHPLRVHLCAVEKSLGDRYLWVTAGLL